MKRYIWLLAFGQLSLLLQAQDRRVVTIEPGVGTLNEAIAGDTLAGGVRADVNTIYELRRNGVYKTTASVVNPGFALHVRAEEGSGAMPIIMPTPVTGGGAVRPFTIQSNLTLEGIYVTNVSDIGTFLLRIIRATAGDLKVTLRNCWLDGAGQSAVRFDSPGAKVLMENCTISHIGQPFNTGNGRVIDVRGGGGIGADSIIVRNNTFFNISRRVIRFSANLGGTYVEIDNNTFVNSIVQFVTLEQSLQAIVTDNLVVNAGFEGEQRSTGTDMFEIDAYDGGALYEAAGIDPDRRLFLAHNWFYWSDDLVEVWADSVNGAEIYDSDFYEDMTTLDGTQVEGDTLLAEQLLNSEPYVFQREISFANAPRPSRAVVEGVLIDAITADSRDNGTSPNWNFTTAPFFKIIDETLEFPWTFPWDFAYDASSLAAISGSDGGPIGDANWPPRLLGDIVVSSDLEVEEGPLFYPNPVVDHISFVPEAGVRKAEVYRLDGTRMITTERPAEGVFVGNLHPGIYLLTLETNQGEATSWRFIKFSR